MMTLFMISIPLMVLAVALAIVPLVLTSHAAERRRKSESTAAIRWDLREEGAASDEEADLLAA